MSITEAWLKKLVNKEFDKVLGKKAKKVKRLTVKLNAYAGKYFADWSAKRQKIEGKIPANFGAFGRGIGRGDGHQDAVYNLGKGYVVKIQHHNSETAAQKYIKKLEFLKENQFKHIVPVHAVGHFAKKGKHWYTYEVLTKLRPVIGWLDCYLEELDPRLQHCDDHEGNIMLDKKGTPCLIDLESLEVYKDKNGSKLLFPALKF